MTNVPDWAKPFLQENEYSSEWKWREQEIEPNLIGVVGISGTKYAYFEVHPVSREQAKTRIIEQVRALGQRESDGRG